jgi:hypothetical protein
MNKLALIMLLALTGCATTPPPPPDHIECDQLGKYARSIETLKQVGVKPADVAAYTANPAVVTFPLQRVQTLIYLKQFDTPAGAYQYFYGMCTFVGYHNLLAALDKAEQDEIKALTPNPVPLTSVNKRSKK